MARDYGIFVEGFEFARRTTFYVGKGGRLLYVDRDVSVATHGADVAKKLADLGVARRP